LREAQAIAYSELCGSVLEANAPLPPPERQWSSCERRNQSLWPGASCSAGSCRAAVSLCNADAQAEVVGRLLRVKPAVALLPVFETLEHTRGDALGQCVEDVFRELDREDGHLALRPPCPVDRSGSWRATGCPRGLPPRAVGSPSQPPSARGLQLCPAPMHGWRIRMSGSPLCGRRRPCRHRCLPGRVPPLGRGPARHLGVLRLGVAALSGRVPGRIGRQPASM
jgi:hypothetical protein